MLSLASGQVYTANWVMEPFSTLVTAQMRSFAVFHFAFFLFKFSIQIGIRSGHTSSTAQGGGGSFKNKKPIREVGCCESRMAERSHCLTERCLRSPLFPSLSLSFSLFLRPINLPTYLPTYLSIYLSICLPKYLSIYISL